MRLMMKKIAIIFLIPFAILSADYVQKPYDSRPAPQYWDNAQAPEKSVWMYDSTPAASPEQIGNNADMRITRTIVGELVRDNTLSPAAKQVIVTTTKGVVNLRGPVGTPEESRKIEEIARKVYGVASVHNQISVPRPPAPKQVNVRVLTPEEEQRIQEYDQQQGGQQFQPSQLIPGAAPPNAAPAIAPAVPATPGARVIQY